VQWQLRRRRSPGRSGPVDRSWGRGEAATPSASAAMRRPTAAAAMAALSPLFLAASLARAAPAVSLEIYYGPMCSHCMFFLSQMLPALFQARLPGDLVEITLLPWVLDNSGRTPAAQTCEADHSMPCHYLPAPLCALQAVAMPAPIDSPDMFHAYEFMICDLAHANAGSPAPQTPQTIQACATSSQVNTASWQECVASNTRSPAFESKIQDAWNRLQQLPPQMAPFIFINGQELVCKEPMACSALRTPTTTTPLQQPGTLLQVVCSLLPSPAPAQCLQPMSKFEAAPRADVDAPPPGGAVAGAGGWSRLQASRVLPATAAAVTAVVGFVALLGLAAGRGRDKILPGALSGRSRIGRYQEHPEHQLYAPCVSSEQADEALFSRSPLVG